MCFGSVSNANIDGLLALQGESRFDLPTQQCNQNIALSKFPDLVRNFLGVCFYYCYCNYSLEGHLWLLNYNLFLLQFMAICLFDSHLKKNNIICRQKIRRYAYDNGISISSIRRNWMHYLTHFRESMIDLKSCPFGKYRLKSPDDQKGLDNVWKSALLEKEMGAFY